MYTCERLTAASGDLLCPNTQQAFMSQTRTKRSGKNMADSENFTFSINDVHTKHVFSYVIMSPAIFFQYSFRSIQDLRKAYPAELRLSTDVVELTAMEHVNQMQHKAHAQAQVHHTQAGVGHARTNGQCKQVEVTRASRLCVDRRVCIAGQTAWQGTGIKGQGTGTCPQRACSGSPGGFVAGVSLPLSLVCFNRAGHQRNATLENRGKRP